MKKGHEQNHECKGYSLIDCVMGKSCPGDLARQCDDDRESLGVWIEENARIYGHEFEAFRIPRDEVSERAEDLNDSLIKQRRLPAGSRPLKEIIRLYIPLYFVDLVLGGAHHSLSFAYANGPFFLSEPTFCCQFCGAAIGHGSICNECGAILCSFPEESSHTRLCMDCSKVICPQCAHWEKRPLSIPGIICDQCAFCSGYEYATKLAPQKDA